MLSGSLCLYVFLLRIAAVLPQVLWWAKAHPTVWVVTKRRKYWARLAEPKSLPRTRGRARVEAFVRRAKPLPSGAITHFVTS